MYDPTVCVSAVRRVGAPLGLLATCLCPLEHGGWGSQAMMNFAWPCRQPCRELPSLRLLEIVPRVTTAQARGQGTKWWDGQWTSMTDVLEVPLPGQWSALVVSLSVSFQVHVHDDPAVFLVSPVPLL
ncbi:hypothetical protein J3458_005248 [Metarhizium acridum]|uniref:uncharacterized protein n=1 Tax=Metarhizium acridum TaxID=92637 RepID=UPI001C6AA57B|nr:hypothetical protein J3458_005248 [Metarhizium acridum]